MIELSSYTNLLLHYHQQLMILGNSIDRDEDNPEAQIRPADIWFRKRFEL